MDRAAGLRREFDEGTGAGMLRTIGEGLLRREEDTMGKGRGAPERFVRIAVEGVDRWLEVVDLMGDCGVRNRLKGKLNLSRICGASCAKSC